MMRKMTLAALFYVLSTTSHAALYTLSWDDTEFYPTDTATFTTAITPYLAVYGQNLYHVHQLLSIGPGAGVGGAHTIFIPTMWNNDGWLGLDGTNSLSYTGYTPGDASQIPHTIMARPGQPPLVGPVPEPATLVLGLAGALGLMVRRWWG